MPLFAMMSGGSPNTVVGMFPGPSGWTAPAGRQAIDVTTLSPQPAWGWTFDGTTWTPPTQQLLQTKAQNALAANQSYLAIASPTNAQAVAQVAALTRQIDALIRLVLQQFDSTSST